jgi:renal tumor antigen
MALFPLFPGVNELDQIHKIHNVLGTPSPELLARKFKRNASHMDFNFPEKKGTGIERLIPHVSPEVSELLKKLLEYDPDDRIIARSALKDPHFRELREAERDQSASSAHSRPVEAHTATSNCSSTTSLGSVASEREQVEEEPQDSPSGTLPALPQGLAKTKKESPKAKDFQEAKGDDEESPEDLMLLPPIGKSSMMHRTKEKEKSKPLKSTASVLPKNTGNVSSTSDGSGGAGHGLGGSKGFEQPQGNGAPLNATGKKFGQSSSLGQSSSNVAAPNDRRDPKAPRQHVSPYLHKQVKR